MTIEGLLKVLLDFLLEVPHEGPLKVLLEVLLDISLVVPLRVPIEIIHEIKLQKIPRENILLKQLYTRTCGVNVATINILFKEARVDVNIEQTEKY